MAKRLSNLERVVDFFVNGDPAETSAAFATVSAIMRAKGAKTDVPAAGRRGGRRKRAEQAALPVGNES